jgi:hypothetical protein
VTNSLLISLIAGGNGKPNIRLALFRFDSNFSLSVEFIDENVADQAFDFGNRPDENGDRIPAVREDAGDAAITGKATRPRARGFETAAARISL